MKKTYQTPLTLTVEVATENMIAQSLFVNNTEEVNDTEELLSRQLPSYNAWGDDED